MEPAIKAKELLQIEIDELTRQLIARREALKLLEDLNGASGHYETGIPTSNKYQGRKLREAMLDRLDTVGHPIPIDEMIDDLRRNGAWLGKEPKRYVAMLKITITQNPDLLVLENEVVARKK